MGIREDFLAFTAPDCSLSGEFNPKNASGNSLLCTAQEFIALTQNDAGDDRDLYIFHKVIRDRSIGPGLYARTPKGTPFSDDQISHDDLYGVVAIDSRIALGVFVSAYSRKFRWAPFGFLGWNSFTIGLPYYYPTGRDINGDRDVRAWMGRFPGLIAHLRIAAGVGVWPWNSLAWAWSVGIGPTATNQDSWMLTWVMIWSNEHPTWLQRRAIARWRRRLVEFYPGGIKDVFGAYFGGTIKHPLAVWAK